MTDVLSVSHSSEPTFENLQAVSQPNVTFGVDPHRDVHTELSSTEIEALNLLKKDRLANEFPDRFLVICLVARKWDIKRTLQLLDNNKKMRKKFGYEKWDSLPQLHQLNPKMIIDFGFWKLPGLTCREGHPVHFLEPAKLVPKHHQFKDIADYAMWAWHIAGQTASIDDHKNGFVIVEDLKNVSFSNIDYKVSSELMGSIQDKIPTKMKKIIMINPPSFLSALMSFAKLFLSKKMLERFVVLKDSKDLDKHVEVDKLPIVFGGKVNYSHEDYQKELLQFAHQHKI